MTNPTRSASRFHTSVARRVIGALAGLALAGGIAAGPAVSAAATTRPSSAARATSAVDFLRSLDAEQAARLEAGSPHVPRTGLRLGDLTIAQRAAAYALLRSLLSAAAWVQLQDLLAADAVLDAAAGGGSAWAEDDYHLALFGDPDADYVLQFSTADVVLTALRQDDVIDVRPDLVV